MKKFLLITLSIFFLFSCTNNSWENSQEQVQIPNPASQNCIDKGGELVLKDNDNWSFWVCVFEDNRQCEEWALYKGECREGGVKITWYDNEWQIYCAITGGEVDMQNQVCIKKDWKLCKINEASIDCEAEVSLPTSSYLDVNLNLDWKDYLVKFEFPYSWRNNFHYRTLENNSILFDYIPKEETFSNMLFSINFAKKTDYEAELNQTDWIPLNNELLKEFGNWEYVMSYSKTLDMPFTEAEDVELYSKMVSEIEGILEKIQIVE